MRTQTKTIERRVPRGKSNGSAGGNPLPRSAKPRTSGTKRRVGAAKVEARDDDEDFDDDIAQEDDGEGIIETRRARRKAPAKTTPRGKLSQRTVPATRLAHPIGGKTRAGSTAKRRAKARKPTAKATTGARGSIAARKNGRARPTSAAKRGRRTGGGSAGSKRRAAR